MNGSARSALPAELAIGASIRLAAGASAAGRHRGLTASRLLIGMLPPHHHGRPNAARSADGSDLAQSTVAPHRRCALSGRLAAHRLQDARSGSVALAGRGRTDRSFHLVQAARPNTWWTKVR